MTVISKEDFFLSEFSVLRDMQILNQQLVAFLLLKQIYKHCFIYILFSFLKYFFKPVGNTKSKNKTPYEINW